MMLDLHEGVLEEFAERAHGSRRELPTDYVVLDVVGPRGRCGHFRTNGVTCVDCPRQRANGTVRCSYHREKHNTYQKEAKRRARSV